MNVNRLADMVVRMILRRIVNRAIRSGLKRATGTTRTRGTGPKQRR